MDEVELNELLEEMSLLKDKIKKIEDLLEDLRARRDATWHSHIKTKSLVDLGKHHSYSTLVKDLSKIL